MNRTFSAIHKICIASPFGTKPLPMSWASAVNTPAFMHTQVSMTFSYNMVKTTRSNFDQSGTLIL